MVGQFTFPGILITARGETESTFTAEVVDGRLVIGRQTCDERFSFDFSDVERVVEEATARGL